MYDRIARTGGGGGGGGDETLPFLCGVDPLFPAGRRRGPAVLGPTTAWARAGRLGRTAIADGLRPARAGRPASGRGNVRRDGHYGTYGRYYY